MIFYFHTAELMSSMLTKCTSDFNISQHKLNSLTTDSAANMLAAKGGVANPIKYIYS